MTEIDDDDSKISADFQAHRMVWCYPAFARPTTAFANR